MFKTIIGSYSKSVVRAPNLHYAAGIILIMLAYQAICFWLLYLSSSAPILSPFMTWTILLVQCVVGATAISVAFLFWRKHSALNRQKRS